MDPVSKALKGKEIAHVLRPASPESSVSLIDSSGHLRSVPDGPEGPCPSLASSPSSWTSSLQEDPPSLVVDRQAFFWPSKRTADGSQHAAGGVGYPNIERGKNSSVPEMETWTKESRLYPQQNTISRREKKVESLTDESGLYPQRDTVFRRKERDFIQERRAYDQLVISREFGTLLTKYHEDALGPELLGLLEKNGEKSRSPITTPCLNASGSTSSEYRGSLIARKRSPLLPEIQAVTSSDSLSESKQSSECSWYRDIHLALNKRETVNDQWSDGSKVDVDHSSEGSVQPPPPLLFNGLRRLLFKIFKSADSIENSGHCRFAVSPSSPDSPNVLSEVEHLSGELRELVRVFRIIDQDEDGLLTTEELAKFFRKFGVELSRGEMQVVMRAVDTDKDGKICLEDLFRYNTLPNDDSSGMDIITSLRKLIAENKKTNDLSDKRMCSLLRTLVGIAKRKSPTESKGQKSESWRCSMPCCCIGSLQGN